MSKMSDNTKTIVEIAKEIAIWAICAITGFLAYNNWKVSLSLERLVVEVSHVVKRNEEHDRKFLMLQKEIAVIRSEQVSRTKNVYDVAALNAQVQEMRRDLDSRKNIRWNLPDMQRFAEALEDRNPNLIVPIPANR